VRPTKQTPGGPPDWTRFRPGAWLPELQLGCHLPDARAGMSLSLPPSNLKRPPGDIDPSNLEATARDEAWKSLFREENASKGLVRHVADKAQSAETSDSKAHTHHRWCGAGGSPRTLFVLTSTWVAPRPLPGASSSRLFNRLQRHRLPPHHGALACSGWRVSLGHSPTWKARQNE